MAASTIGSGAGLGGSVGTSMRRVVNADGRVLVVDFETSTRKSRGLAARIHRGHGHVGLREVIELLVASGLRVVESGTVGTKNLHFALAKLPQSA